MLSSKAAISSSASYHAVSTRQQWTPGASRIPWLGLAALFISLLGIAASTGILIASDGVSITTWKFQPTVYLSIASTISNITLHFALTEGINIAWWRTALKGSSLRHLHQVWDQGYNLYPAITSGGQLSAVAMACILVAVSPINGPLLQRASRVSVGNRPSMSTLQLPLAPVIPYGYTGYISSRGELTAMLTGNFSPVAQAWTVQQPIQLTNTGCEGLCSTNVRGAGFAVNCSSHTVPFNMTPVFTDVLVWNALTTYFDISFEYTGVEYKLNIGVQYKGTNQCIGNLQVRNCTLQGSTVEYPVIINGNQSTISLAPASTIWDDKVVDVMQGADSLGNSGTSRYGGLFLALSNQYSAHAEMYFDGVYNYIVDASGSAASQHADVSIHPGSVKEFPPTNQCQLSYEDPLDDVLKGARELLFRTAIAAANLSNVQHVTAQQITIEARYESHYDFLAGGVLVTVLAMLLVSFLFQGYWVLGRSSTMSPIEIAKAFKIPRLSIRLNCTPATPSTVHSRHMLTGICSAPLMRNEDSNAEAKAFMKEIGGRLVRYGAINSEASRPESYSDSTQMLVPDDTPRLRLEIADPHLVLPPMPGWRFTG